MPPNTTQKLAVTLAFIAAALSLGAVVVAYSRHGQLAATPLFGGLFMFFMALSGWLRLRKM